VEHYEIAAYGAVSEIATALGQTQHASLLEETLAEESETDEKLADLAEEINSQAREAAAERPQDESERERKRPKHAA
jgi:ferritin-like metal-binding protein YciE